MKTALIPTLALAATLLVAIPAFANDDRGAGANGGGGRVSASAARGAGGGSAPVSNGRFVNSGGGYSAHTFHGSTSVAYGGGSHSYTYNNQGYSHGGNGRYTYAFASHSGWNPGRSYYWRGHNYRWYGNGWFIVDPYPYYYGYPGYYDTYYGPDTDAPDTAYAAPAQADEDDNGGSVGVQVQRALARQGYYRGPIDGIVGPGTHSAIAAYQRDNGLRPTGTINSHLLDALDLD